MNNPEAIKKESNSKQSLKEPKDTKVTKKKMKLFGKKKNKAKNSSKEKSTQKKSSGINILEEKSVNLIPVMSREEVKEEEKKKKMNKGSLVSLLFLFTVSILVVGFSIVSQIELNYQKEKLYELEENLKVYNQLIIDNNQILERVYLYKDVQEGRYSTTEIVNHIQGILDRGSNTSFSTFGFSGKTGIDFSGETRDLEELSKIWYLLSNDPKLDKVNLKTLSKGSTNVSFNFEANINLDQFTVYQAE
jgi:hypothetical protein